jgi:hypothetical protein
MEPDSDKEMALTGEMKMLEMRSRALVVPSAINMLQYC